MPELPPPILDYVLSLIHREQSPAYLYLDEAGRVLVWGGSLELYGLSDLKIGEPIGRQAFFLEGLLPLNGPELVLPRVKTEAGRSADIHIFQRGERVCVLLLDTSATEAQVARTQQKVHELSLLREKKSRSF